VDCPTLGGSAAFCGGEAMHCTLLQKQDVGLLVATALTAVGYLIGAAAFIAALLSPPLPT